MQGLRKQEFTQSNIDFARIRETQIPNVLALIKTTINSIRMCLIMPHLGADMAEMEKILSGTLYYPAVEMMEKLNSFATKPDDAIDGEILHVLLYFQDNSVIAQMFPRLINNLSKQDKTLLVAMQAIYDVTKFHLTRTARSELDVERELHLLFHKLAETKAKTLESIGQLRKRRALLRWRQAIQFANLGKLTGDLATQQKLNNKVLERELDQIHRELRDYLKDSVLRHKEVEEELNKARTINERHNANIAGHEKAARAEKNKLMIQLDVLTTKFDTTLLERMRENLVASDKYKKAKQELDAFMIIYRKEEAIYKRIVLSYELEEKRKLNIRIATFMMNIAARKIQRYWGKWREIKLKKERRAERLAEKKAKMKKY